MYVAQNCVDVVAEHEYFGASSACEQFGKDVAGSVVDVDSHYLVARCHAVAHMGVAEIEGVAENYHFVLHSLFLVFEIIDGFLYVVAQIADGNQVQRPFGVFYSGKFHQHLREPCGKDGYRIKDYIQYVQRQGKDFQGIVGVYTEDCLGKEFAGKKNHTGGNQSLGQQYQGFSGQPLPQCSLEELGCPHTVNYQNNIVAHQDGGDEQFGIGVEESQNGGDGAGAFAVELYTHAVAGYIRHLASREQRR